MPQACRAQAVLHITENVKLFCMYPNPWRSALRIPLLSQMNTAIIQVCCLPTAWAWHFWTTVCSCYLYLFPSAGKAVQGSTDSCQCKVHPCMGFSLEQDGRFYKCVVEVPYFLLIACSLHLNVDLGDRWKPELQCWKPWKNPSVLTQ